MEQTIQTYEEDEFSLLDILVTLAESWRLLVFGPLMMGVLAGGLSFLWPKTYESVSIVRIGGAELALLNTPPVLDSLIERFGLLSEFDGVQNDARQYLVQAIVGKVDSKTGFATITATASTPEKAKDLSAAAVDALLKELLPKGQRKKIVEEKILSNDLVIADYRDVIDQLEKKVGKSGQSEAHFDAVMRYYLALTVEVQKKHLENIELKKSLEVGGDELFVQRASLPDRKASPRRNLIVLMVILSSGFALLLLVFVRKAIASAEQDPEAFGKLNVIRTALGLRTVNN